MVKRQRHRSDEIMMIPFLDILCSLIGVLVLIIVVLVIAQTQRINGRSPKEIHRAEAHLRMLKVQKTMEDKFAGLAEKLQKLRDIQQERETKQADLERLRDLFGNSAEKQQQNKDSAGKLQSELEMLIIETQGLAQQEPVLKQKIQELAAEIDKLKPPERKEAPVAVNPSGSGLVTGTSVFFVDASGDKLTFFWNEKEKSIVSAVPEVIVADTAFNLFLDSVKKVSQCKIIFLLRDDGMRSYNLGAGWAQSKYGFKVEQIGKLPIPGRGDLDMRLFSRLQLLGNLPMPAAAKPPPEAPTPPKPPMPAAPQAPTPNMAPTQGAPPTPGAAATPVPAQPASAPKP